jgi:hypothetical protein
LFLSLECEEALYGGAAGGGKSDTLLMGALEHVNESFYNAIIFRRTYADLILPDAIMDRARAWLQGSDAKWSDREKTWLFPSGARLSFGYLDNENDKYRYQGAQFAFIGFDELTQHSESSYLYLFSRLRRSSDSRIPLRMRATSNPGGIGAQWVNERFIPEGFTPEQAIEPKIFSKMGTDGATRYFVPARLQDNPHLDQESYIRSLERLDPVTRDQLLRGDWQIRERGNIFPMWEDGFNGRHVITWSQFANVYGERHIPMHWLGAHGHDSGFDPDPRAAVWNFVAGANGLLAGDVFCIRELYENRMTVDDFADVVKLAESQNAEASRIQVRVIGHEASSEQATLSQKHRLHYSKATPDANGGIAQLRHYLRVTDTEKPHPFKPWLMGRPHFYVVVADDQLENARTSDGMVNFRAEIAAYRYINADPGQRGTPRIVPYGFFNHLMDAQRMVAARWFANISPLSKAEKYELKLPEAVRHTAIEAELNPDMKAKLVHSRQIAEAQQRHAEFMRKSPSHRRRNALVEYRKFMRRST